jgi:hypothetical protein
LKEDNQANKRADNSLSRTERGFDQPLRATAREIHWSDLTKYERALLTELRKDGILIGPEHIRKMKSQIYFRPHARPLTAVHIFGETIEGELEQLLEARRPEIDAFNKHRPANPDFKPLWNSQIMKLSLNLPNGWLGLSAHGGTHFVKKRLWPHDNEDILAALIGEHYARKGGPFPHEMKFTKAIREKARAAYFAISDSLSKAKASQFEQGSVDQQWTKKGV